MSSFTIPGGAIKILINGFEYPWVNSIDWEVNYNKKILHTVDSLIPVEIVLGPTVVTGSLKLYRIRGSGGPEGMKIINPLKTLTREKYFTLTVIDRYLDNTILHIDKCSVTNQSWEVTAKKDVLSGKINFNGIVFENELDR